MKILLILFIVYPRTVYADEKKVANIISYGTVITQITIDTIHSLKSSDKKLELKQQSLRVGITILSSEIVKRLVGEDRPDHSDNLSFWSEHSALAGTSQSLDKGWRLNIGIPLTTTTAAGRVVAKRHHWWDTIVGASVGIGVNALVEHYVH